MICQTSFLFHINVHIVAKKMINNKVIFLQFIYKPLQVAQKWTSSCNCQFQCYQPLDTENIENKTHLSQESVHILSCMQQKTLSSDRVNFISPGVVISSEMYKLASYSEWLTATITRAPLQHHPSWYTQATQTTYYTILNGIGKQHKPTTTQSLMVQASDTSQLNIFISTLVVQVGSKLTKLSKTRVKQLRQMTFLL